MADDELISEDVVRFAAGVMQPALESLPQTHADFREALIRAFLQGREYEAKVWRRTLRPYGS